MIPCKKIEWWQKREIEKFAFTSAYLTETVQRIYIFKSVNGFWYYYYPHSNAEIVSEGFSQKKEVLDHIEKTINPTLTWKGQDKIYYKNENERKAVAAETNTQNVSGKSIQYWEDFIINYVVKLLNFAKQEYNVDLNIDLTTSFIQSYRFRRSFAKNSWMGKPQKIVLRLAPYLNVDGKNFVFNEYKHIEKDPHIGEFKSENFEDIVMALCCHEVAHSIRQKFFNTIPVEKSYLDTSSKKAGDHAEIWQTIYFNLRKNFLPHCSGF